MLTDHTQGSDVQAEDLPHDSRGPTLLAIFWSAVASSAMILGLRLYCKIRTGRGLWWDDYIALSSWVSLVIFISLETYLVVPLKYGSRDCDIPPENLALTATIAAAAYPFLLLSIMWSKSSFGVTLLRITTEWMKRAVWGLIISINVFLGFSILIYYIQCTPVQALWDIRVKGKCWDRDIAMKYHVFSGVWSSAVDLTLVFFPWKILWGTQMLGREKWGISIAMSMGIFAAVASSIKTAQLHLLSSTSTYKAVPVMYWGPIEVATTIIAASIPALRLLIKDVRTSARATQRPNEGTDSIPRAQYNLDLLYVVRLSSGCGSEDNIIPITAGRGIEMTTDASRAWKDHGSEKGTRPHRTNQACQ
ncbi:hypothetical protein FOVSG1_006663 [Fusarium oxysporum f. sp. vasinfectum]